MSRLDVPTLMCDRCKLTTQELSEMGEYQTLRHSDMGGESQWDLCPDCWAAFRVFMKGDKE